MLLTIQIVKKQLHNIKIGKWCVNNIKWQDLTLTFQWITNTDYVNLKWITLRVISKLIWLEKRKINMLTWELKISWRNNVFSFMMREEQLNISTILTTRQRITQDTRFFPMIYKIIQYMSDFKQSYVIHQEVQTSFGMRSSYPGFDSVCSG